MEQLLNPDTLRPLFKMSPVSCERAHQAFLDRATILRGKQKFDDMWSACKKEHSMLAKQAALEERKNRRFADVGENYVSWWEDVPRLMTGQWIVDDTGIHTAGFENIPPEYACPHPIAPTKRFVNIETGREKMEIAWNKDGTWQGKIFDKSSLATATKIVGALSDYGVNVTSESAKSLVRYLSQVEDLNIDMIPVQMSTGKMGWLDDYTHFRPYYDKVIFDAENAFSSVVESVKPHGDEQKFMDILSEIRHRKRKEPMMLVSAALASVLVEPLGLLPFVFHLYGEAGKGKTVATMLAAAVWGDPNEKGYISDPKSTVTAIEVYLDCLNNLPYICDDISKVQQEVKNFSDFIYMLCSGTGKKRSNKQLGVDRPRYWRNCSITNGEKPITSEISNGGELLRTIEMETAPGLVFDDGQGGKRTADIIRSNYGFLGKKYIEVLQEIGMDKVAEINRVFADKINAADPKHEKEGKPIQSMAAILTADKILTDYIMHDGIYLDFWECFGLIRSHLAMSDNDRAYEYVLNECAIHRKNFEDGEFEPQERWGHIREQDGAWLINSNVFGRFAAEGNFNKKMFVEWAVRNGKSEVNPGRLDKRVKIKGINSAYIVVIPPPNEPEPELEPPGEDLPF